MTEQEFRDLILECIVKQMTAYETAVHFNKTYGKIPFSIKEVHEELEKEYYSDGKIHTTIGIYPDGSYKTNGVESKHLKDHIKYNKSCRPGRALMIDGVIVLEGYAQGGQVDVELLERLKSKKVTKSTVPYQ